MQSRTVGLVLCVFLVLLGVGLLLLAGIGMEGSPNDNPFRLFVAIAGGALGFAGVVFGDEAMRAKGEDEGG